MHGAAELSYMCKVLKAMNLQVHETDAAALSSLQIDFGLRSLFGREGSALAMLSPFLSHFSENTLIKFTDEFGCSYAFLSFSGDHGEKRLLLVGPFVNYEITREHLHALAVRMGLPQKSMSRLESIFSNITFLQDAIHLYALLTVFAETLYGKDGFTVVDIDTDFIPSPAHPNAETSEAGDLIARMQALEARYAYENEMIELISRGSGHKAQLMMGNFSQLVMESRNQEPLRNMKNYAIILNTLLRKAVEKGGVHPIYIDKLSAEFARSIERTARKKDFDPLLQQMIRKYCALVKKHALRRYAPLVQKAIVRIDMDLAGDLSLSAHAKALNVSPGYLSTLFKKETGVTLTEFVTRRRMEHAAALLRETKLPVSLIAQRCGIGDDNYFIRLFRRYTGFTPKQFRKELPGALRHEE